jgi:UDP-N-acetylglucosamine 2-epimerase (non-hydrolysing)
MKIMTVVGARPNFMKAAPIIAAIKEHNNRVSETGSEAIHHILVHTGQHYDQLMSDSFFADLDLPQPDVHLGVGSASHAIQTAEIMRKFEDVLLQEKPDVLVVVGDVNSTLACALVAAKISFDAAGTRPLIAHVEAGLRSFDRTMPEEINRIVTDQLSDLLFVTEESGLRNLAREGVPAEKVHFVGNTMIDSLLACKEKAEASAILDDLGLRNGAADDGSGPSVAPYALLTLHRPANVDTRDAFLNILEGLEDLARECPVVFPAHPRTQKRIRELGLERYFALSESGAIRMIEPLRYLDFLCLMKHARVVVTDSGGIQEETTCLGIPCVTVRENTERPVTLKSGTNVLAGVQKEGIRKAVSRQLHASFANTVPENWDGKAALRITEILLETMRKPQLPIHTPHYMGASLRLSGENPPEARARD